MEENKSVEDEIEESLRICEELMSQNEFEDLMPAKPILDDWEELANHTSEQEQSANSASTQRENKEETQTPQIELIPAGNPLSEKKKPEQELPDKKAESKTENKTEKEPERKPVKQKKEKKSKKRGIVRTLISLVICIAIAVAAAILITKFVANHTTVDGTSMEPALYDGDNLIIEKLSYMISEPKRFDVIVFRQTENTNYIKRIVGLPGEQVRIEEGKIYINEAAIYDAYGDGSMEDGGIAAETVTLGVDEYFVLGDNRDGSEDSRDENVGPVKADQIIGRAWLRVTPFERFGIVENEYRGK